MNRARRATTLLVLAVAVLATACTRVHPHVALPPLALGEPSFFPTLEAYTATPIVGGNRIDVLLNGDEIFPAVLDAIASARKTITYAQYFFEDGPNARQMVDALAERCRHGVGVNVLLDSFGALGMPGEYAETMRRSGCHVVYFRPLARLPWRFANNRNHRRILVIDGRQGFTGGSGVSWKWLGNGRDPEHWRETDVRVEGPVVEYLQGAFAENWLEATGIVLGGDAYFPRPLQPRDQAYAQVIRSSPAGGSFALYTTFLLAISSAQRSIYITNPYFVPDQKLTDALIHAVNRGVRVMILVPGLIDHNLVRQASRAQYGRLLKGGVELYEYRAALLHAKTMVIDGIWSTIGSTNLDNRSLALNDELNVAIYSQAIGHRLEEVFFDDLGYARRVEYRRWRARGMLDRILELLAFPLRDLM